MIENADENENTYSQYNRRIKTAFAKLKDRYHGCAYCGYERFYTTRIQKIQNSSDVYAVNFCPKCKQEDWLMVNPTDLALVAVVLNSGL